MSSIRPVSSSEPRFTLARDSLTKGDHHAPDPGPDSPAPTQLDYLVGSKTAAPASPTSQQSPPLNASPASRPAAALPGHAIAHHPVQQRGGIEASPPASQQPGRTLEYVQPTGLPSKPSDVYPQPTIPANWLEDQVNEVGLVTKTVPTEKTQQNPEKKLNELTEQQAEARKKVDELEASMAAAAAAVGPMTPEQYQAFCQNYKNEKGAQALYENLDQANQALAAHLQENKEILLKAAETNNATTQNIYDAMAALASSRQSNVVIEFSKTIYADPNSALSAAFQGKMELREFVIPTSIGQEYINYLERYGGDDKTALQKIMEDVKKLKGIYSNTKDLTEGFEEGFELLKQIKNGKYEALDNYGKSSGTNKLSSTFRLFINLGSLAAAATSAGTKDEAYVMSLIKTGLDTGSVSAGLLGTYLKSLSDAGSYAALGKSAKAIGKFSKILGTTGSLLGSIIDSIKYDQYNGNVGDGIALIGSYISTFSSFVGLLPGAQGAVALMGFLGLALSVGGDLISDVINLEQRQKMLLAAGVNPNIVYSMAKFSTELVDMMNTLKLNPTQLQQLLIENPEIGNWPDNIKAFTLAATTYGISSDLVIDFARKLEKERPGFINNLKIAYNDVQFHNPAMRDETIRSFIVSINDMDAFLTENSKIYNKEQQNRNYARIDFENLSPNGNDTQYATNIIDLITKNNNPEYVNEIMRQLVIDSGNIDIFISGIINHTDKETLKQIFLTALEKFEKISFKEGMAEQKTRTAIAHTREKLNT